MPLSIPLFFYLSGRLPRKCVHQLFYAVVQKQRGVEGETRVRNVIPIHMEAVRHQRVPVVQVAELEGDTIAVLEALAEEQRGIKLEFEQVAAQVLHVLFRDNLDDLTCRGQENKTHSAEVRVSDSPPRYLRE